MHDDLRNHSMLSFRPKVYFYINVIYSMPNMEIFIRYNFHSSLHVCEIDSNADGQLFSIKSQSD